MQGYVLYLDADGAILREKAEGSTRRRLIGALDDATPEGAHVLGMILGQADERVLRVVA